MLLDLARLPMDRRPGAREGGALFEKREVDLGDLLHVSRRRGTVRSQRRAYALGLRAHAAAAHGYATKKVSAAGDATFGASFRLGNLHVDGEYPLLALTTTSGTLNDSHLLVLKRLSGALTLNLRSTGGAGTTGLSAGVAVSANAKVHVVVRIDVSATTIDLTVGGAHTGSDSLNYGALGAFAGSYWLQICGSDAHTEKVSADAPAAENIFYFATYESTPSALMGTRSLGSPLLHFDTGAGGRAIQSAGSDTSSWLMFYPAQPAQLANGLRCGGRSGAFVVKHSPSLERLWSTELRAVADDAFTFCLSGVAVRNAAAEQVLLDYGDLGRVVITAANFVAFTFNGSTVTTTGLNTLVDGESFTILAGRDGDEIFLRLITDQDQTVTATSAGREPPRYDYRRARDLVVGSDEDPAATGKFSGLFTRVAAYPWAAKQVPADAESALFHFDFVTMRDQGLRSAVAAAVPHAVHSGEPDYGPCAIQDAEYMAVHSGEAIAESGLEWPGGLRAAIGSDSVAHRFGDVAVLCSGGEATVLDLERQFLSPLDVPEVGEKVSVSALGSGPLQGARCHALRYRTAHGTYGPWRRLQPVVLNLEKAIIGSSSEEGQDLESELGESYGLTKSGGESRFRIGFSGGAPADGVYPVEVQARIPEMDEDIKEMVWHRGARRVNGVAGSPALFDGGVAASFDPNRNWAAQRTFRFKAPATTSFREAQGVFGFGELDTSRSNAFNADFVAYITSEGWGGTRPRLVVGVSRTHHRVSWVNTNWYYHANYKLCLFTNDDTDPTDGLAFWKDGNDYSVFFVREGSAIKVYVHDITRDVWTTLTARSMTGLPSAAVGGVAGTIPATANPYSADTIFQSWQPFSATRYLWFASANYNAIEVADISAAGAIDTSNYYSGVAGGTWEYANGLVRAQPGNTVHYQSRFWTRSYPLATLKAYAGERYAAQDDGALATECLVDIAHIVEDGTSQTSDFFDRAGQAVFVCLDTTGSGCSFEHFEQDAAALAPSTAPIALFAPNGTALSSCAVALYFTELGNGQLILRVGSEGQFVITEKLWSNLGANPAFVQLRSALPFVSAWNELNWFAFGLDLVTSGGSTAFTVKGMAVNATTVFPRAIGGGTTMSTASYAGGWIHLGGHANGANNAFEAHLSEFRLWDVGDGPDVQKQRGFEYQGGRVSPGDYGDLALYAKFQRRDEYNNGDGLASATDRLYDYGLLGGATNEWQMLGANPTYKASIFDVRTSDPGSSADPQPLVVIPSSPRRDIVAVQIAATALVPILDFEDESEVQAALASARIQPLALLDEVPIGATHYIDAVPDDARGSDDVDERDGFVPNPVRQVFAWGDHLCAVGDDGRLWVSTPGPGGWASYPIHYAHDVDFGDEPDTLVAGAPLGNNAVLLGKGSVVVIGDHPTAPRVLARLRSGGANSPRCVATDGNAVYAFNGRLWRIGAGEELAVDIGAAVQDLLPAAADARLEFSEDLASLLVVDTSSGRILRLSMLSGWGVEDRDARALGETADGYGLVTRDGAFAVSDDAVYGDDLDASSPASVAGTKAGNVVTLTPTGLTLGMRCAVRDAIGLILAARITVVGGGSVTFDSLTGLANGAVTVYPGVGPVGWLLDTGDVRHALERGYLEWVKASIVSGSPELGVDGYSVAEDLTDRSDLTWDTLGDGVNAARVSGAVVRAAVRAMRVEAVKLASLEAMLSP